MILGPTDVTVILGQRGCGKSWLGKALASCYPRLVVIDRMREWNEDDADLCTDSFDVFTDFLRANLGARSYRVVFQFDVEATRKNETFSEVIRCSYYASRLGLGLCILIEEVHHFASPYFTDPWLFEAIMTGRHAGLAVIASSQRPASVSKALISQASHVFAGRLFEKRDTLYLRECIGNDALAVNTFPVRQFLHYSPGQKSKIIRT